MQSIGLHSEFSKITIIAVFCCIGLYSLSTNVLIMFLPSSATRTGGSYAGLGLVAMVCVLIQGAEKRMSTLTKKTGCV